MPFEAQPHDLLVPFTGDFRIDHVDTHPPKDIPGKNHLRERLAALADELNELQRRFYARDQRALLLIFQAMDAAGKDSTIRAVMTGIDPAGCYVHGFKQPREDELQHDFLWRTTLRLPSKGMIGIFNRSYYEEVLVVRVHPEYLKAQRLPETKTSDAFWEQRLESIRDHEHHLARNGTVILKFWLNVSREEQRQRFISRLEEADKHWKFKEQDVEESKHWHKYMQAYEAALNATSRPWAPWYAIPADDKPYMRVCVAEIIVDTLKRMNLDYPELDAETRKRFKALERQLKEETNK
ncbi:MAG: polyphosphate kinase 2 family protein [Gammaproteobacteria bacterium]|nr:polyphosphate kinase 2 family protein [Gammaproteobacteria bacterium]